MLNSFQKQCIPITKHLLIIACPGSGKTTVLTHKAQYLLSQDNSNTVLAVTFTRESADELKSKIMTLSSNSRNKIGSGTFHSLSKELLKKAGYKVNLISPQEIKIVIQDILYINFPNFKLRPKIKFVLLKLSEIQSAIHPEQHPILLKNPDMKLIYDSYEKIKKDSEKMDFADLLYLSVREMRLGNLNPFKAKYILGDEAQDMDEVQHAWIQCHADAGSIITLVADDDQSIYGFRQSAGFEGLKKFRKNLGAIQKLLPINYRCGKNILNAAENLIRNNNSHRVDKPIESGKNSNGEIIVIKPFPTPNLKEMIYPEFDYVAELIYKKSTLDYKKKNNILKAPDWAILARNNQLLNVMEICLKEWNIPYFRKSGSIWDVAIAKDYLAILKYLATGEWFGFSLYIKRFCDSDFLFSVKSLFELYQTEEENKLFDEHYREQLRTLLFYEERWHGFINSGINEGVDGVVLCLEDVRDFLKKNIDNNLPEEKQDLFSNILNSCCDSLVKHHGQNLKNRIDKETLTFFKANVIEKEKIRAAQEGKPFVELMTLHSSKGLEFDNVAMIGCSDEFFLKVVDGATPNVREERRLFYVGMTRAKNYLLCTYSNPAEKNGFKQKATSMFLDETMVKKSCQEF